MNRWLRGIGILIFLLFSARTAAVQAAREPAQTETRAQSAPQESQSESANRREMSGGGANRDGGTALRTGADAAPATTPKETIFGMDPTIALLVAFSACLVLVVAILALSTDHRRRD
jgi:hypothetical protein